MHPKAADSLKLIDNFLRARIKKKLKLLEDNAEFIGKPLKYSNFWSLRIGDYRAIYEINKNENRVIILFIGHRKNVYVNFNKLF